MILFIFLMWYVLKLGIKKHGNYAMNGAGDYLAMLMASFMILSTTMWPIIILMTGKVTYPVVATNDQRIIAALISCGIWFIAMWYRPQVYLYQCIKGYFRKGLDKK